jgi:hypothetical protein
MTTISNAVLIKRNDLGPRFLTAILITFAVGFVLLQLSVQLGAPVDSFDALGF